MQSLDPQNALLKAAWKRNSSTKSWNQRLFHSLSNQRSPTLLPRNVFPLELLSTRCGLIGHVSFDTPLFRCFYTARFRSQSKKRKISCQFCLLRGRDPRLVTELTHPFAWCLLVHWRLFFDGIRQCLQSEEQSRLSGSPDKRASNTQNTLFLLKSLRRWSWG